MFSQDGSAGTFAHGDSHFLTEILITEAACLYGDNGRGGTPWVMVLKVARPHSTAGRKRPPMGDLRRLLRGKGTAKPPQQSADSAEMMPANPNQADHWPDSLDGGGVYCLHASEPIGWGLWLGRQADSNRWRVGQETRDKGVWCQA